MSTMRQREKQLRRQCRALLRDLNIRPPLDVTELCHKIGEHRSRSIRLLAHPIPMPGPFGVWITTVEADYILYQQETSKAHQDHIIVHELGHMLAGHHGEGRDDQMLSQVYPDLDPDAVRRALRRTAYDTDHEREAELVATIILEWASVLDRVAPRRMGESTDPVTRYDAALSDRMGWL